MASEEAPSEEVKALLAEILQASTRISEQLERSAQKDRDAIAGESKRTQIEQFERSAQKDRDAIAEERKRTQMRAESFSEADFQLQWLVARNLKADERQRYGEEGRYKHVYLR